MKIAFFMGSPDISGGSYVIFQHALYLHTLGHAVTVVVQTRCTPEQLAWHPATQSLPLIHIDDLPEMRFDLAIATWWKTALELHRLDAAQYAYFVQSIESRFYPAEEVPLRALVDGTYALGLPGITEATWIRDHLRTEYGADYALVRNGVRKDIYSDAGAPAAPRLARGQLRVLVEGQLGVFFKNVDRTLALAREAAPDEIFLLTSSAISRHAYADQVYSRVPIHETARIYRSCDVLVKLSYVEGMFGPPLEMFHCGGTAIVYDVTGHDEYIQHGHNGLVVPRDDEAGALAAIRKLRADPDYLDHLKQNARATADAWPDWDVSSQAFGQALLGMMDQPRRARADIRAYNEELWRNYERDEGLRLRNLPSRRVEQKLRSLVKKLPPGSLYQLKKMRDFVLSLRRS